MPVIHYDNSGHLPYVLIVKDPHGNEIARKTITVSNLCDDPDNASDITAMDRLGHDLIAHSRILFKQLAIPHAVLVARHLGDSSGWQHDNDDVRLIG